MIELIAAFNVHHFNVHIISDNDRYGWVMKEGPINPERDYYYRGFNIGSGRPFELSMAERFGSLPSCLADLKDDLSYTHGIRRMESKDIIAEALSIGVGS